MERSKEPKKDLSRPLERSGCGIPGMWTTGRERGTSRLGVANLRALSPS